MNRPVTLLALWVLLAPPARAQDIPPALLAAYGVGRAEAMLQAARPCFPRSEDGQRNSRSPAVA